MILETYFTDDIKVVKIIGQIDYKSSNEFMSNLLRSIEGTYKIIMDLEELTYMNSMGLGILVKIYSELKKQKAEMKLCSLNEEIRKLFTITKLDNSIMVYDNLIDAVISYKNK